MDEMKDRCILNDSLISKYKFPSPGPSSTITSPESSTEDLPLTAASSTITSRGLSIEKLKTAQRVLFEEKETLPHYQCPTTSAHSIDLDVSFEAMEFNEDAMEEEKLQTSESENEGAVEDPLEIVPIEEVIDHPEEITPSKATVDDPDKISKDKSTTKRRKKYPGKKYYCPFCRQLYSKFARHILQVHGGEKEVQEIAKLTAKDIKRKKALANLRAEGTRIYNSLQCSPNKLILPRQKVGMKKEQYIPCYMCGNMYKTKFLHRHVRICPSTDGSRVRGPVRAARSQLYQKPDELDESVIQFSRDVLSGIREGEIKQIIKNDPLFKEYGKYLCSLYGSEKHLVNLIRRKLRQIAEVLLEMRRLDNNIIELEDIFYTTHKSTLFQAIRNITGFVKGSFKRPALANELGILLQHCARRLISRLLEENDKARIKNVRNWIELIRADYNALISKHARKNLDEKKWNKPKTLPLTEDLLKLNNFVRQMVESSTNSLKKGFNHQDWQNLSKATMVKIIIFNRKRVGDVQRIRVDDFKKAHNVQRDTITYQLLSESERVTCSRYMRVEARGKHAKVVPMLLTKEMMDSMKLIISLRQQANIPNTNPFVFARNADEPLQASTTLRYFAYNCGAESPKFLTGTKLRQQIATATQAFNFSENDLSILANYLGHTLQTHRDFYRLPDEAIHLAKISKVLEIVDSGKAAELKGKSLSELENYVTSAIEKESSENQARAEVSETATMQNIHQTPKKRTVIRRTWTTPEKHVMKQYFKHHLANGTLPTPDECKDAKFKYTSIRTRTVDQIKAWVNNYNKRLIKQKSKPQ